MAKEMGNLIPREAEYKLRVPGVSRVILVGKLGVSGVRTSTIHNMPSLRFTGRRPLIFCRGFLRHVVLEVRFKQA